MKPLALLLCLMVSACSPRVYPDAMQSAQLMCKDFGGLEYAYFEPLPDNKTGVTAKCRNGTTAHNATEYPGTNR